MPAGLQTTSPIDGHYTSHPEDDEWYWVPSADAHFVTFDVTPIGAAPVGSILRYCVYTTSDSVRHLAPSDSATSYTAWVDHHHTFFIPAGCLGVSFIMATAIGGTEGDVSIAFSELATFCQYGGENDPDKSLTYVVGDVLLDSIISLALVLTGQLELLPYVTTAMAAIEGTIPFAVDCTIVPTGGEPLDLSNPSTLAPANLEAWLHLAAWSWFCRCVAAPTGAPDPVLYVPPPVIAPPGVDNLPAPTIVCDETQLCAYLNHLEQLVAAIGTQVGYLRTEVRLIQRQGVPFGYLHGTSHAGLTGQGHFTVADILGLEVAFTSIPALPGHSAGDPDTYHQIGKISVGTVDGWRRSWQPTHSPYLIFPISGAFTKVGYTFPAGVTATITELLREP